MADEGPAIKAARSRPSRLRPGRVIEHARPTRHWALRLLPFRTMDRHVGARFLAAWVACAFSFTGVYIMVEALTKLDRFLKLNDPLWVSLPRYHAAMVPTIFVNYLGPAITAAAAVVTIVYLQRGNELEPMKASGVSVHRTILPIFILAAGFAGLTFYLQEELIPRLRGPIRRAISLTYDGALRPDPFFDLSTNQLIKIAQYMPAVQVGRGVEIGKTHSNGTYEKIVAAEIVWVPEAGSLEGEDRGHWVLHNGSIQRQEEDGTLIENLQASQFARLKEPFQKRDLPGSLLPIDLETSDQDIAYLSFAELKTQYRRQPDQRHLAVKLHHHVAFPLNHIILPAIAIPLVILIGARSILLAVAGAVLVCGAFYLTSSLAMSTAVHSDAFSPLLAAWLPVLLFGSMGVTLTANMRT